LVENAAIAKENRVQATQINSAQGQSGAARFKRQSTTQEAFVDVLLFSHLAPGASAIKHMQALFVEEGYPL
jgi:hypothetical protein